MPDVAERLSDMGTIQSTAAVATAAQISPAFFDMMFSFLVCRTLERIFSTVSGRLVGSVCEVLAELIREDCHTDDNDCAG